MVRLIVTCLVLAALSLLMPSEPSYDPLAWLIWGRELAQLTLDTAGGPSWKPLPVAVTAVTAPLGKLHQGLPAAVWMLLARAGALLALAMAFRLAFRLGGRGVGGALGGAVAVVAVTLTPDWLQFTAHGSEAPLAVAFMLWAVERHLDGRVGHAVALGTLACLLRPELVPFLGVYGLWAWFAAPSLRPALVGVLLLLPAAWVVPEWIGSGNPLDGGKQARSEPVWSLSLAERPWLRALERVHNHAGLAVELLALAGVAGALMRWRFAAPALALAAIAEIGLYVAMTEAGFSGNPRYVLPALVLLCVVAGAGAAFLLRAGPAIAVPSVVALALVGWPFVGERAEMLENETRQVGVRMKVHRDLARAVDRAGGAPAVAAFGSPTTNRALHTRLAWELGVPVELVESLTDHRVVFRSRRELLVGRVYLRGRAHSRETLVRVGSVRVYRRDGITLPFGARRLEAISPPFTPFLQGFHSS